MKIIVVGSPGTGKTTLGHKLSKELAIPYIELDAFLWEPNWKKVSDEVFRERVKEALKADSWVIDGNYSISRDLIWTKANVAIWLDYSAGPILRNLLKRTVSNIKSQKELWPGCRESFRMQFFSKNSIFVWFAKSYRKKKRAYPELLTSFPKLKVLRLTHPSQLSTLSSQLFAQT